MSEKLRCVGYQKVNETEMSLDALVAAATRCSEETGGKGIIIIGAGSDDPQVGVYYSE